MTFADKQALFESVQQLAKLFIRMDLMAQISYGIPLVTKRYRKTVFEFLDFFLRVTISFDFELESNVRDDTQDVSFNAWIEKQIRENPKITTEDLSKLCGKSVITVKRHIAKLSNMKYVGSGYSGHWEIVEK